MKINLKLTILDIEMQFRIKIWLSKTEKSESRTKHEKAQNR